MKEALRRLSAYFIDLVVIYLISAFISSFIIGIMGADDYLNGYNAYIAFEDKYQNFFDDFKASFKDNELAKNEYNQIKNNYADIIIGLDEAYEDEKLTKKEYNEIEKLVKDKYSEQLIAHNYNLSKLNLTNMIVTLILTFGYFVIIQYLTNGQTLGKKILKIKVIDERRTHITLNSLLLRSLVITDIIWASIRIYCLYTMKDYQYFQASQVLNNIMYLILFISLLCIVFRKDRRALQDLVAGTKVVQVGEDK